MVSPSTLLLRTLEHTWKVTAVKCNEKPSPPTSSSFMTLALTTPRASLTLLSKGEDAENKLDSVANSDPVENALEIRPHRGHAQLEFVRDVFVLFSTKYQLHNARLLRSESESVRYFAPQNVVERKRIPLCIWMCR